MKTSVEGEIVLIVGVLDEHYFRGNDEIHIDSEEFF
jgi:DNA/RNA endonuclease YhcR with UshA esterase domain